MNYFWTVFEGTRTATKLTGGPTGTTSATMVMTSILGIHQELHKFQLYTLLLTFKLNIFPYASTGNSIAIVLNRQLENSSIMRQTRSLRYLISGTSANSRYFQSNAHKCLFQNKIIAKSFKLPKTKNIKNTNKN